MRRLRRAHLQSAVVTCCAPKARWKQFHVSLTFSINSLEFAGHGWMLFLNVSGAWLCFRLRAVTCRSMPGMVQNVQQASLFLFQMRIRISAWRVLARALERKRTASGRRRVSRLLGRPWPHSKRGWSGLIAGKTDDGRRSCSGSVYCAEEGGRKGSLICSVCCIHDEPLGFGRIPKEVASTKAVEYRTVSGRVVYYGRMLYLVARRSLSSERR